MNQGNIAGIAHFFKSEYAKMTNYVHKLLSESADRDSEDIVHDVMLNIFEKADISGPIEDLAAYVYRALKNRVIDILRKKTPVSASIDDENSSLSYTGLSGDRRNIPEIIYEKEEINSRLFEAIESLPVELKKVLLMNEIEGRTFKEISESTGIPSGTLMARKARAMESLRIKLENYKNYMEE